MSKAIKALQKQLLAAKAEVARLEQEFAAARLTTLRQVDYEVKNTLTVLTYGKRVVKAKHNRYGRYDVYENNKRIAQDYGSGLHQLRFDIAMGSV